VEVQHQQARWMLVMDEKKAQGEEQTKKEEYFLFKLEGR
jgi:hypothetical protein